MRIFNNKRAEAVTLILVIVIVAVFVGWLIDFNSKECRSNANCNDGFYCGSDFACHQIPVIEKTLVKNNLVFPSIIIGIAIVIAAIVLKLEKIPFRKKILKENQEKTYKNPLKLP